MTLPNFLIIGPPKCGTTALFRYLRQHPDVFMPREKEPRFLLSHAVPVYTGPTDPIYARRVVTSVAKYEELFASASSERAIGEASTLYLYTPGAENGIRRHVPGAKMIAVLRNPVDRAYSNFLHQRYVGAEPLADFDDALRAEPARIARGWSPFWYYAELGRYQSQLERFYRVFGRDQLRVYLYDDFETDRLRFIRDVFRFLGVDDAFVPDVSRKYNVSSVPRIRALSSLVRARSPLKDALRPFVPERARRFLIERERSWNRHRPPLDPLLRQRLVDERREEIGQLATFLDRDLSRWLEPRPPR